MPPEARVHPGRDVRHHFGGVEGARDDSLAVGGGAENGRGGGARRRLGGAAAAGEEGRALDTGAVAARKSSVFQFRALLSEPIFTFGRSSC